jgi:lipoprotein-anchoring transpeptidase ErfK/SrfK
MEGTMKTGSAIKKAGQGASLIAVLFLRNTISAQTEVRQAKSTRPHRVVLVSIPDRRLAVLEDGVVLRTFAVSVGASKSPSPVGEFQIITHVAHPSYSHNGTVIPAGPNNPLGPRWMGLSIRGYGIHGTNAPHSIGKAASHGCIRLSNHDIIDLFPLLSVGDTVEIRAERDPQIARIFGDDDRDADNRGAVDHSTIAQAHHISLGDQNHAR